ncbi:MAG: hypothetical protein Q8O40_04990 [Chloroflexota bacterium]|nr:hypothetical protein [Chloroflexota bacterium]
MKRRTRRKWQRRAVKWAIGFAIGWALERAVGTVPLLIGLLALSLGAYLLRMRKAQRWSLDNLWGQLRDMLVFAMLPPLILIAWRHFRAWLLGGSPGMTAWDVAWPIGAALLILIAAYDVFGLLPRRW